MSISKTLGGIVAVTITLGLIPTSALAAEDPSNDLSIPSVESLVTESTVIPEIEATESPEAEEIAPEVTETPAVEEAIPEESEELTPEVTETPAAEETPVSEDPAEEDVTVLREVRSLSLKAEETPAPEVTETPEAEDLGAIAAIPSSGSFGSPLGDQSFWISSYWGNRCIAAPGAGSFHGATDFAAKDGTPIYAAASGTVTGISSTGPTLTITADAKVNGQKVVTSYTHMWNPGELVKMGQKVKKGQLIAKVGNAGISNGAHLHFAITVGGKSVDSLKFLKDRGVDMKKYATYVKPYVAAPKECPAFVTAKTAVFTRADYNSSLVTTLAKNSALTVIMPTGEPSDFQKVRLSNGKVGYVLAGRLSPKKMGNYATLKYKTNGPKGHYMPRGTAYLFDYPSSTTYERGIGGTLTRGELLTTTGRTYNGYSEVYAGSKKGWIALNLTYKVGAKGVNPTASVDSVKANSNGTITVKGWVFDADAPSSSGKVVINVDGKKVTVTANKDRADVQRKYKSQLTTNKVGFEWTSSKLTNGSHSVSVTAVNAANTKGKSVEKLKNKKVTTKGGNAPKKPKKTEAPAPKTTPAPSTAKHGKNATVYRFWSAKFNNAHFYTANKAESDNLRKNDKNWTYQGAVFNVWLPSNGACTANEIPVYRFYSSKFASHFYTVSKSESDSLRKNDKNWAYEGVAFCGAKEKSGTQPVYRFWSPKYEKHFYTASESEMKNLRDKDKNWSYEGVAFYAPKK